jgi:hypothetical protein
MSPRDKVDSALLCAIYKNAVNFLITEDKDLHKRANRLALGDRVFSIIEAIEFFQKYIPRLKVRAPPAIQEKYVYEIDVNDPIFDSLKKDYDNFESWFKKISQEGRKCWVYYRKNGDLGAILIPKFENEPLDIEPPLPRKKRLKICTLKVIHTGYKLGELFIKLCVDLVVKNKIDEIYLTYFTKKEDRLVNLITEFGFKKVGVKDSEGVYLKKLIFDKAHRRDISPLQISQEFYPSFYDGEKVKKFIIPILPVYHQRLFTDLPRQTYLQEHTGEMIIEGNTIKKAYLSHSKIGKVNEGDIILFYRSKDKKSITSLGVVEKIYYNVKSGNDILNLVGKRSVYTKDEINKIAKKPTLVILFRHHFHFPRHISLSYLKELKVLKGAPQSIMEISHEKYIMIKKEGKLDECFTVN